MTGGVAEMKEEAMRVRHGKTVSVYHTNQHAVASYRAIHLIQAHEKGW
jgi:hypothetical protein